ncbi:M15 family metallopeptidase [Thermomonas sp.]|uniref:M15 family metallopeptidase n=1 Tax=Thermomonas sp. TaxID=1971895 RepID=UPI0031BB96A1
MIKRAVSWLCFLVCSGVGASACTGAMRVSDAPVLASATTMQEAGLVDLRSRIPDIDLEIRYAGRHNFIGIPIDGYDAPRCWLKPEAADALARVEAALRSRHLRLRIFDCYRPARAVAQFVRWMDDPRDLRGKAEFYPDLDKSQLRGVYIAPVSGHSRGATVDLTLLRCVDSMTDCQPLDMGTGFDFFGLRAHTDSPEVSAEQRANRDLLRNAMQAHGFINLPEEWWHYRLEREPSPRAYYDVPITGP